MLKECILVVPCHNEAERLDADAYLQAAGDGGPRFLFVDDGSTDATAEVLVALQRRNPGRIEVLRLEKNQGKAEAVRRGMLLAIERGARLVGFWDADLATPLEALGPMVDILDADERVDIVLGSRVRLLGRAVERRWQRHVAGRLFATLASWTLSVPVYDTQCGAKLFRVNERTEATLAEPFHSRWVFDVEILARYARELGFSAADLGGRIVELPLERWHDVDGSKVRPQDFVTAATDLGWIAWAYRLRK
ncbi:MAG: glycosyltransferase family 2 protein [Deltaproteobacteria bacterium]|nr:MAG: glycosyltransferase family 2 protein [Deltaproteobacteria bacterium]